MTRRRSIVAAVIVLAIVADCRPKQERKRVSIVASEAIVATGLPQMLVKTFAAESGAAVDLHVADGRQFASMASGGADVAIAGTADLLSAIRAAGPRRIVSTFAYDDFIIAGPGRDPAGVLTAITAADAFRGIAWHNHAFCSASEVPALRDLEAEIWAAAEIDPRRERRYRMCIGNAAAVLRDASRHNAYTLTDRATFESVGDTHLVALMQHTPMLRNDYTVVLLTPRDRNRNARWFVHWLMSNRGRELVAGYRFDGGRRFYSADTK